MFDADNMCTIDEQEAEAALMQMGVSEDDMGMIMDVLKRHAGEDEQMSFDEFKAAVEELMSEPSDPSGPSDPTTAQEDEEEIKKGEKAAEEKDEETLEEAFDFFAGDDGLIQDTELTDILNTIAADPDCVGEECLPQEMVMPIVEFVGFFVPEYGQCTMNWEMNFADFEQMVETFESGEEPEDMEAAFYFSMVDADNKCYIDEKEAEAALELSGLEGEAMYQVMDVLGKYAGNDEKLDFEEFKGAMAELMSGPERKLKIQKKRFSLKKKHMGRKLMKLLRSQAA